MRHRPGRVRDEHNAGPRSAGSTGEETVPPEDAPVGGGTNYQPPAGTPTVQLRSASYGAFIYQKMVGRVSGSIRDGDLVAVMDKQGRFFGWGFYNSRSQIALRMLSHEARAVGEEEIALRIRRAVELRREILRLDDVSDAYRLVHAEGDGLSGLVADRFGDHVAVELFSLAMYRRVAAIEDAFVRAGLNVRQFVVRADKASCQLDGFPASGVKTPKDAETVITENTVRFKVSLSRGHKTGFFCDQRDNRLALSALTPGRSVLDVCCYTGGFACYAARLGKAASVTAVDLDEQALAVAADNAVLNAAKIDVRHADAFDFLRAAAASGKRWDVVVLDPAKFVARREQLHEGLRKYADLNRLAAGVVADGGMLVTCSCSGLVDLNTFRQTVARSCRSVGRTLQIVRVSGAAADHPVMADAPQSEYLKVLWGRMG